MLKMRLLRFLVVATVLCAIAATASAALDLAPSWRGSNGSTYQNWGLGTNSTTPAPDSVNNPYGTPTAAITVGEFGEGWFDQLPGFGSQSGFWDMGSAGTIALDVNNASGTGYNEIWVQVTYFQDLFEAPTVDVSASGLISFLSEETQLLEHVGTGGDWFTTLTKWRVDPNPNSQTITVTSGMMGSVIDNVTIDAVAVAVPEPSSMIALLMGGSTLLMLRRRRA